MQNKDWGLDKDKNQTTDVISMVSATVTV